MILAMDTPRKPALVRCGLCPLLDADELICGQDGQPLHGKQVCPAMEIKNELSKTGGLK